MVQNYKLDRHLNLMQNLPQYSLKENQFAQLIGRCRLYQHLPKEQMISIPALELNDGQIYSVVKEYCLDESFSRN